MASEPLPLILEPSRKLSSRPSLPLTSGCRFTTLRGYQLCAPPDQPWVERIIRRLKKSSAKASLTLLSPASILQTPVQDSSP